ncbi:hypothetical protein FB645_006258 [Coemansia sp. IMI 203386]|nr:hypothetical protein FB645_006258 [Coemansia sp. IMI 203386]
MFSLSSLAARTARTQSARYLLRPLSTVADTAVPKNLQPGATWLSSPTIETPVGILDLNKAPPNVRSQVWQLYATTLPRLNPKSIKPPKKSTLNWLLQNAETKEELDLAQQLTHQWRMSLRPITQATTDLWVAACVRLKYPTPFLAMLDDRWKYRPMPINQNMARFIKLYAYLGLQKPENPDTLLEDVFRVFALYPYYDLKYDAAAYGALVQACCAIGTEESWRRALVVAEEALAFTSPKITREALKDLETRSRRLGESEMAQRYQELADTMQKDDEREAKFDEKGNFIH